MSKLLANVGSHINPLDVIERIAEGMEIPGLRDKLVKIIRDYNIQTALHVGCSKILRSDIVGLCSQHVRERRRGYVFEPEDGVSATEAPPERREGNVGVSATQYFCANIIRPDSETEMVR